jgi:dethiobiotin synthase
MNYFFITGTDTNVGKTIASAVLVLALKSCYWKPIQSGLAEDKSEAVTVQELTGCSDDYFLPTTYSLQASLAVAHAAELENKTIDLGQCILPQKKSLIIEGGGGVFHPLNSNETMMDLMKKFNMPVIIVSRGTLGTINHTLLTIEALRHRNIKIHGIVFCGKLNPKNQKTIEEWGKVRTLFHIPYFERLTPTVFQGWVFEQQDIILAGLK